MRSSETPIVSDRAPGRGIVCDKRFCDPQLRARPRACPRAEGRCPADIFDWGGAAGASQAKGLRFHEQHPVAWRMVDVQTAACAKHSS